MKLAIVFLTALLLVASVVGCQQPPQPSAIPSLAIMVESNIVEAGSSFIVSGSNFKPHQNVWVNFEWRTNWGASGVQADCEADENGSIYPIIEVPEDTVPGDYEVKIYTGINYKVRQLIATLPIHVQAKFEGAEYEATP
jgi:hypothetical protein